MTEGLRIAAIHSDGSLEAEIMSTGYTVNLIFRVWRPLIKALMWLTLGLAFSSVIGVLGVVGFAGCLYHLLDAFNIVRPVAVTNKEEAEKKLAELKAQILELDPKAASAFERAERRDLSLRFSTPHRSSDVFVEKSPLSSPSGAVEPPGGRTPN